MDEKMKRESKTMMENLFKANDVLGSGAVTMDAMKKIVHTVITNFEHDEELESILEQYTKVQKYTVLNPKTRLMEVKFQEDSIDFPSAMAIVVRFLKKNERRTSNAFAGKGLIRFSDLPGSDVLNVRRQSGKQRLY